MDVGGEGGRAVDGGGARTVGLGPAEAGARAEGALRIGEEAGQRHRDGDVLLQQLVGAGVEPRGGGEAGAMPAQDVDTAGGVELGVRVHRAGDHGEGVGNAEIGELGVEGGGLRIEAVGVADRQVDLGAVAQQGGRGGGPVGGEEGAAQERRSKRRGRAARWRRSRGLASRAKTLRCRGPTFWRWCGRRRRRRPAARG